MNILNKLSVKNLKLNKKRTISTIIGITLSVALITGVCTLVSSFRKTLIENAINEYGYYHICLEKQDSTDIKKLESNRDIKDINKIYFNGYGKFEESKNEYKPYVKLISMNDKAFKNMRFKLEEGRFAQNSNEIVISNHMIKNGEAKLKIGDTVTFDIGDRKSMYGDSLNSNNPYEVDGLEEIVNTNTYTFKIVGIIDRPNYSFEDYEDPGYTIITNNSDGKFVDCYMSFKKPKDYKDSICELLNLEDYNKLEEVEDVKINDELLRWECMAFSDSTNTMLFGIAGVVIFIIIFTSIFCIRNSFEIAVTEKIKMYGMLASVGATKKQIKKNVIFEAFLLGIIGIPLGIISGFLAIWILLKIVNMIIGEYLLAHVEGIVFGISIISIVIATVLGLFTIYLSALSSARKASKVSPIDSIRNSANIKIKSKKLKTPKIIKKLFKTGGVLAYKNLKRSKKKYRTTVISIAVSVLTFISMNTFVDLMFGITENYYTDFEYNLEVYYSSEESDVLKITNLDNVDKSFVLYDLLNESIEITDYDKIENKDVIYEDSDFDEIKGEYVTAGEKYASLGVFGLDTATFKKYLKKAKLDYDDVKGKCVLVDKYVFYDENGKGISKRTYNYKKGDTIKGKIFDYYDSVNKKEFKKDIEFDIGAISGTKVYGYEMAYIDGGYIVVNIDDFKDKDWTVNKILINSSNPDEVQKNIEKDFNVHVNNMDKAVREEKSMVLVTKIFLYGFIGVITLIGVTNIFNTITSNIELRQKEFAMLKSIGMTKREFNRMINLETLFYGTKALIYGIILGLLGTLALNRAAAIKFSDGLKIPYNAILLSIIFVYILVFVIMRYSVSKVNKQNTIETIRKDNI